MDANQQNQPLVHMERVSKIYQMGRVDVPALRGIDLEIQPGDFVAIVGASGSGKTTLMNIIGCLDLPSEGTYKLLGQDISRYSDRRLAALRGQEIGFVFQNYSLLQQYSALHNVQIPHYYAQGRGQRTRALSLLEQVGLRDRARHKPTELSGGEQQRVAIARALMNAPKLLLADEPTGNLDSATGQEIINLLQDLNRREGLTLVVVTHDPAVSAQANRVVTLHDGLIVSDKLNGVGVAPEAKTA
ncbi:MAG: ABC transporter ATP-binding protein [Chloroflexi bacterium]|nr:ABC transporter ATP-binding protein [Chloroflexota bacterium]